MIEIDCHIIKCEEVKVLLRIFCYKKKGCDSLEQQKKWYRRFLYVLLIFNFVFLLFCLGSLYQTELSEKVRVMAGEDAVLAKKTSQTLENTKVIPGGIPVGIYIETEGALVLGTESVEAVDGRTYEPAKNIVKAGDYIKKVNGIEIHSKIGRAHV